LRRWDWVNDKMKKQEILNNLETSREKFLDAVDPLNSSDFMISGVVGEWSIKDILAHLSRWEAELIKMLWQIRHGMRPTSIHFEKNFAVDQINIQWFTEAKHRPLDRVMEDFHAVRIQTVLNVEQFTERDLTDPLRYRWLKKVPLSRYIAHDSFEHEQEHLEEIKSWIELRSNVGQK
jgi:hypothetical protein